MKENLSRTTHHIKKVAKLRYKDEILKLYIENKLSIREITKIINYKLIRTRLKTSLSQSSIYKIIKENE